MRDTTSIQKATQSTKQNPKKLEVPRLSNLHPNRTAQQMTPKEGKKRSEGGFHLFNTEVRQRKALAHFNQEMIKHGILWASLDFCIHIRSWSVPHRVTWSLGIIGTFTPFATSTHLAIPRGCYKRSRNFSWVAMGRASVFTPRQCEASKDQCPHTSAERCFSKMPVLTYLTRPVLQRRSPRPALLHSSSWWF